MKTLRISAGFAIGVALLHGCLIGAAQPAFSASILTLPDTSQTSTFQATIGEQINVVVPTIISFGISPSAATIQASPQRLQPRR